MIEFIPVTMENIETAARIHSISWKESHRAFCSEAFIEAHSVERQTQYIRDGMACGKQFFILTDSGPKGIVSVKGNLIEDLYVLPSEQRRGYGTMLLHYAEQKCQGTPTLWILSNNAAAERLYAREGYRFTGRANSLTETLQEFEMQRHP